MRHPLFVDSNTSQAGLPRNILQADGEVTVFDTALDPQAVWAVTLWVWWHTNSEVPVDPPRLLGRVYNNGEAVSTRGVFDMPATAFTALSAAQSPYFAPFKLLDKLCLRGSQILKLQNTVAANENCFVWGYAERAGESVISRPYRPLQPEGNNLVSPYVGDPKTILVADGETEELVVHKLSNTYIDYLTLHVAAAATEDPATEAKIVFPNGVELLMPFVSGGTQVVYLPLFDGIPMRAPASDDVDIVISLTADGGKQGYMGAYGSFLRD
jgi:hypothetical protein